MNQERADAYRAQNLNWQLPAAGHEVRLTAGQQRRIQKKRRAHNHYGTGRCLRCRPLPRQADALETRAMPGPVTEWSRS
jgi:hypothetical protein